MLSYIQGMIEEYEPDAVVIDHQGMGFRIYTSKTELEELGGVKQEVRFYTHLHVREDDMRLFGFTTKEGVYLFEQLLSVSGIGPKGALAILSVLTVHETYTAIMTDDAEAIAQANGVGQKTAKRVILELKNKIEAEDWLMNAYHAADESTKDPSFNKNDAVKETATALVGLGYTQTEAMRALRSVKNASELSEEALLKAALKELL